MTDERANLIVLDYPAGHRRLFSWCLSGDVDCIDEIATAPRCAAANPPV